VGGHDRLLAFLRDGELTVQGRMPWSSNATFLVDVTHDGETRQAVYKPVRGERPLWDFPPGLGKRETAAWELSVALGWDIVPPTVLRDGPLGEGSLQLFVDADFEQHYFTLLEDETFHPQLRMLAAFDIVANNTDRKGGHCLLAKDRRIYGIDHGLAFHEDFKLRTVIWDFGGEAVPDELLEDLRRFVASAPTPALAGLLTPVECRAVVFRARALVDNGVFPIDQSGRQYPWPLV
jgi:uncharacterized repeat protein (TIGR03843 family)